MATTKTHCPKNEASYKIGKALIADYIGHQRDDGRHPDAVRGWDKYKTQFIVDGRKYEGKISIMLTQRGDVFYDMTKIKDITSGTSGKDLLSQSTSRRSDAINKNPISSPNDTNASSSTSKTMGGTRGSFDTIITEKTDLSSEKSKKS